VRDGVRTLQRNARLTPLLADEHRLAPMAVVYTDTRDGLAERQWFPTRPLVFPRATPAGGRDAADIRDDLQPVWVPPSGRTIATAVLASTAVLVAGVLLWKFLPRIKHNIELMRMSPRERALRELSRLLARGLVSKRQIKDFYLELTMIVRRYIERAHGIRAPEQTTAEFLAAVREDRRFSATVIDKLRTFLQAADLVKFARFEPAPEAIERATGTAREYIETDASTREQGSAEEAKGGERRV
jgi:hypothetical protein